MRWAKFQIDKWYNNDYPFFLAKGKYGKIIFVKMLNIAFCPDNNFKIV